MSDRLQIRRALISVSDKTAIEDFAKGLAQQGVQLVSTGGTAKTLRAAGLEVIDVSEVTGFPEIMGGRVKTLHPKVHGGLLADKSNQDHMAAIKEHEIEAFDLLCVNLYPFNETLAKTDDFATLIENIDIGGPAMVRASAKNHDSICVVTDASDYQQILDQLQNGGVEQQVRRSLAAKAFAHTAAYDSAIATWLTQDASENATEQSQELNLMRDIGFGGRNGQILRYGENPHQLAAIFESVPARPGVVSAQILQGKALSYNNLNDADAAFELVSEFNPEEGAAVAIIKHANPCGVARAATLVEAWDLALRCDPVSAFGGIIACNIEIDAETATKIATLFTEVIIAPSISAQAKEIFAQKKNLRVLETGALANPFAQGFTAKTIAGGLLVQSRDNGYVAQEDFKVVTKVKPTEAQLLDMRLAWRVAKHVKSNAIIYVKDGATVGIGAGQMSRVDSAYIAGRKAQIAADTAGLSDSLAQGSVVASDAFFPFADGLLTAIEAGAKAVIQPGGSIRDDEVIAAADEAGIAMVLTGMRHFKH